MKALLLVPPNLCALYKYGTHYKTPIHPPIGLIYLAAVLNKEKIEVKIIDASGLSYEDTVKTVEKEKPDVVGMPCFTDMRVTVLKLAQKIKGANKDIKVVLGGMHPTYFPKEILANYPQIDYVVIGEGEITFPELIKAIEGKMPLETVDGIAFRDKDKVLLTKPREFVKKLDELPYPAHHLLDWRKYPPNGVLPEEWAASTRRHTAIITSRGCPYRCIYCAAVAFWGSRCRVRSVKNVVDEIEMLYRDYGVTDLSINDDTLTIPKTRAQEICKEIIKRGIKVGWSCNTRVDAVDRETLELMKEAGCNNIYYGVESCSEKILRNIKKYVTPEQIINTLNTTKDIGIFACMGLMVGNPGETWQTIRETLKVIKQIDVGSLTVSILIVFPNTEVYAMAKEKKFMDDSYWLTDKPSPFYTVENSTQALKNYHLVVQFMYYWNKGDYFQALVRLFRRFWITDNLLSLITFSKELLGIKTFGLYKLLKRHPPKKPA